AVLLNVINIVLDYPFIFGFGVIPGMGVAGAALASTISQYIGAALALTFTLQRYGFTTQIDMDDMHALFQIGGNMFLRTSFLMLFLIVSTRVANVAGAESGAAHQVIRQIYVVTALSLDAFAVSTQSLVGYFLGADDRVHARQAAVISIGWSVATGIAMTVLMLLVTTPLLRLMVPDEAIAIFIPAWIISAVAQPVNAVSFSTDGIHMGSGDYGFLRNAMFISTVGGIIALLMINPEAIHALSYVWLATTLWVTLRAIAGLARIFVPEFNAPLAAPVQN
ncbi:MAG: MATE family efflux transporter, partial [Chloroflexota bacterium]